METTDRRPTRGKRLFAFIGFLLGLGAPVGWLFWRAVIDQPAWLRTEWAQFGGFYLYLVGGTITVFTLFGYFIGRYSDRMSDQSKLVNETLQKVKLLAITDALTNLYNAGYLHEQLSIETESAKRYNTPLACLMMDIDDFKLINDKYGHPSGDFVLTELAKIMRQCVRRVDIVGRLGGEEFLIIMPHTSFDPAFQIAERIRQAVQHRSFKTDGKEISITISVGVSCYPSPGVDDKNMLIKAADDALYEAKRTGKNRTVFSAATAASTITVK